MVYDHAYCYLKYQLGSFFYFSIMLNGLSIGYLFKGSTVIYVQDIIPISVSVKGF